MNKIFEEVGVGAVLGWALLVLAVLILIVGVWASFLRFSILFRYLANNKKMTGGKTAKQVAEGMLAKLGYTDIQVVKTSYLYMIFFPFWGNRYSPRRKKILLYKNILNKSTVTAIALATQKVGLVIQHKEGDKKMAFRARWEPFTRWAPNLFLPIVTAGFIIDLLVFRFNTAASGFGVITLIGLGFAILYTVIAMYAYFLVIPTERRAGELALQTIKEHGLVPEQYLPNIEALYKTYVKQYIADFLLAILSLVYDILYLLAKLKVLKK